jgi:hypothetical protein
MKTTVPATLARAMSSAGVVLFPSNRSVTYAPTAPNPTEESLPQQEIRMGFALRHVGTPRVVRNDGLDTEPNSDELSVTDEDRSCEQSSLDEAKCGGLPRRLR